MKKFLCAFFAFTLLLTACGQKTPVSLNAEYAADEEISEKRSDIIVIDDDYGRYVKLGATAKAEEFCLFSVETVFDDEGNCFYREIDTLYEKEYIDENETVIIKMNLPEIMPLYAVSYKDENGETQKRVILLSGKDGSLLLSDFIREE